MESHQLRQHLVRAAELGVLLVERHQELEKTERGTRLKRTTDSEVLGYTFTVARGKSVLVTLARSRFVHLIEGDRMDLHTTNKGNITGIAMYADSVRGERIDRNRLLKLASIDEISFGGEL